MVTAKRHYLDTNLYAPQLVPEGVTEAPRSSGVGPFSPH